MAACALHAARGQVGAGDISAGAGPQASISGAGMPPAPAPVPTAALAVPRMGPHPVLAASPGKYCSLHAAASMPAAFAGTNISTPA